MMTPTMDFRRYSPFLLSTLLSGALMLACVEAKAGGFEGNYTLGHATFYDTINTFPPSVTQSIPVANATVFADDTFILNASGVNATMPITGTVSEEGNLTVTGPLKTTTGAGNITGSNFTLSCSYLVPQSRVTYHYLFKLVGP
jgi:hypothetical protein